MAVGLGLCACFENALGFILTLTVAVLVVSEEAGTSTTLARAFMAPSTSSAMASILKPYTSCTGKKTHRFRKAACFECLSSLPANAEAARSFQVRRRSSQAHLPEVGAHGCSRGTCQVDGCHVREHHTPRCQPPAKVNNRFGGFHGQCLCIPPGAIFLHHQPATFVSQAPLLADPSKLPRAVVSGGAPSSSDDGSHGKARGLLTCHVL